ALRIRSRPAPAARRLAPCRDVRLHHRLARQVGGAVTRMAPGRFEGGRGAAGGRHDEEPWTPRRRAPWALVIDLIWRRRPDLNRGMEVLQTDPDGEKEPK